ncbi:hypothetical protein I7I48_06337 [Histoplasma ohiense]|nr:hypothetical protein I7I48_06337 [Histoplasma ohiense (nom. inval.)]
MRCKVLCEKLLKMHHHHCRAFRIDMHNLDVSVLNLVRLIIRPTNYLLHAWLGLTREKGRCHLNVYLS